MNFDEILFWEIIKLVYVFIDRVIFYWAMVLFYAGLGSAGLTYAYKNWRKK